MSDSPTSPQHDNGQAAAGGSPAGRALGMALGGVAALALGVLLYRLLYQGQAQSFDTMIYSQTMWGLAHGEFQNTILNRPGVAVHANLVLAVLAPLTWVLPASLLLILLQSGSFGATVGLTSWAFTREAARRGAPQPNSVAVGIGAALLTTLGSAVLLNPWLFDARPDLIGVPLLTYGLLRALDRGEFDRTAVLWMLAAALGREEFALAAGAGLVLAPVPREATSTGGLSWRTRWVIAIGCGVYFALYLGIFAIGMGDTGNIIKGMVEGNLMQGEQAPQPKASSQLMNLLYYKGILLLAIATSAAGLPLAGWRWLGSCLPGLGLILINRHVLEHQLSFHYSALIIPGMLVAALAAYRDWPREGWRAHPAVRYGPWLALGVAHFVLASAAPGGGRFFATAFDMRGPDGEVRYDLTEHSPQLLELHAMIQRVPPEDGLALPYAYGASVAGRAWVKPVQVILTDLSKGEPVPEELDSVVLYMNERFFGMGLQLVSREGFRFVDHQRGYALLSRSPQLIGEPVDWTRVIQEGQPGACAAPLGSWPEAGLALCEVRRLPDGRLAATLARTGPPKRPVAVTLFAQPTPGGPIAPLGLMGGLVPPHQLPQGWPALFNAAKPLGGSSPGVLMLDSAGRALVLLDASGEPIPDRVYRP